MPTSDENSTLKNGTTEWLLCLGELTVCKNETNFLPPKIKRLLCSTLMTGKRCMALFCCWFGKKAKAPSKPPHVGIKVGKKKYQLISLPKCLSNCPKTTSLHNTTHLSTAQTILSRTHVWKPWSFFYFILHQAATCSVRTHPWKRVYYLGLYTRLLKR